MSKFPKQNVRSTVTIEVDRQHMVTNPDGSITVHIPITFKKHGGRKYIIAPDAVPEVFKAPVEKEPLLKAIGQAFEWKAMLEEGRVSTMAELSRKAKMNQSYIARVMRLTLLAPDIIEAILNGRQPAELTLLDIFRSQPYEWSAQRKKYGFLIA